jgi:hypothetical protein
MQPGWFCKKNSRGVCFCHFLGCTTVAGLGVEFLLESFGIEGL